MIIFWGKNIKPETNLKIHSNILISKLNEIGLNNEFVIGTEQKTLYGIPLTSKKRVLNLNKNNKLEEINKDMEKTILKHNKQEIDNETFEKQMIFIIKKNKENIEKEESKQEEGFKDMLKLVGVIAIIFIIVILLKYVFKLF